MFTLNLFFSYDTSNFFFRTYLYVLYYEIVAFLCYKVQNVTFNLLEKNILEELYNKLKLIIIVCEDISTQEIDVRAH
jgi:hypothetical protein